MKLDSPLSDTDTPQPREHQSGSFLLRIWSEQGEAPRVRVFIRNLKTGEEQYLGDLDQLGDTVLRQFQQRAGS
jgi:hypothetical protein